MLEKRTLCHCEVEVDQAATRKWYEQAEEWGCECGDCLNFVEVAKQRLLPQATLDILDSLGIPPEKATYVCHLTDEGGMHLYELSYRVAGSILHDPFRDWIPIVVETGHCYHEMYPYGAPDFPQPHFDLGFSAKLPWVLETPRE